MVAQRQQERNKTINTGHTTEAQRQRIALARTLERQVLRRHEQLHQARQLMVAWPAWPHPVAHVESRSTQGHFHVVDLEAGWCDCPASTHGRTCLHRVAAALSHRAHVLRDVERAAREGQGGGLPQAGQPKSTVGYETAEGEAA